MQPRQEILEMIFIKSLKFIKISFFCVLFNYLVQKLFYSRIVFEILMKILTFIHLLNAEISSHLLEKRQKILPPPNDSVLIHFLTVTILMKFFK